MTVAAPEAVALGLADEYCPAEDLMARACGRAAALALTYVLTTRFLARHFSDSTTLVFVTAALALMVEVLCTALTGAAFSFENDSYFEPGNKPRIGHAARAGLDGGAGLRRGGNP